MDAAAISRPRVALAGGGKLRAWLVLGRVSNLPTVWSNCLAACSVGGWNTPGALLLLGLGGTLLYTGGMFLNDACDVDFDAEFRRERPIVSGALSRRAVIVAAVVLFLLGIALVALINLRAGLFAVGLTTLIVAYNWTHKRIRTGPLLMAGCRVLLYLTAASAGLAGLNGQALAFAIALGFYIAGLSYIARGESRVAAISRLDWLLLFAPVLAASAFSFSVATFVRCLPLVLCIASARSIIHRGIGHAVGLLLAGIVLVDFLAVAASSATATVVFIALFGLTLLFQKFIPAT